MSASSRNATAPPRATYSISDLAREFALTTRAIRFYEDSGLLAPRREKRTRVYGERERVRLKLILRGKRLGLALSEIAELLDLYEVRRNEKAQLTAFLVLLADRRTRLVVDLGEVKKIDSSGIETLLTACQRARDAGGDVRLARVPPRFQTLLEIAHLTNVLKIYPDAETASKDFVLYTPKP